MRLLRNRVLIKLIDDEIISGGGIIIPKTVNHIVGSVKAQVIMLGEKSMYGDWWLSVGDFVKIDKPEFAIQPFNEYVHEGEVCYIVNEDDISCSIESNIDRQIRNRTECRFPDKEIKIINL